MDIRDDDNFSSGSDVQGAYELPGEKVFWATVFEGHAVQEPIFLGQIASLAASELQDLLRHLTTLRNSPDALIQKGVAEDNVSSVQKNLGKLCNWVQRPLAKKQAEERDSGLELAVDPRKAAHSAETAGAAAAVMADSEPKVEAKAPRQSVSPAAAIAKTQFVKTLEDPAATAKLNRAIFAVVSKLDTWRSKCVGLSIHKLHEDTDLRARLEEYSKADKKGGVAGFLTKAKHQLRDVVLSDAKVTDAYQTATALFSEGKTLLESEEIEQLKEKIDKLDEGRIVGALDAIKKGGYDPSEAKKLGRRDTVAIVSNHVSGLSQRLNGMVGDIKTQFKQTPDGLSTLVTVLEQFRIASEEFLAAYEKLGEILGEENTAAETADTEVKPE